MLSSLNPRVRDWRGRRVWIVGASSGIGAAVARELFTRGARVALSVRSRPVTILGSSGPKRNTLRSLTTKPAVVMS